MTVAEKQLIQKAVKEINESVIDEIRLMELCGTHTHQIARLGLRNLLTPKIHLVSGPGCPICVTEPQYIDALIDLLKYDNVIVATFGDLLRVRGTSENLEQQKARGKQVITVYSPEDVLPLARSDTDKSVVFAAVGFETTAPIFATLIQTARMEGIENLYLLTSLKRMEPAVKYLLVDAKITIDGMLCPGHVAAITGIEPFVPITETYQIPAVICGFDALDLISSISLLCKQVAGKSPLKFENLYPRCVSESGNETAKKRINEVFDICDGNWRGIGTIKDSALKLNGEYQQFDASKQFALKPKEGSHSECHCGSILIGEKTPDQCTHFGKSCTPSQPLGPCMISSEGACAAYYKYGGGGLV